MQRRDFLHLGGAFLASSLVGSPLWQRALAGSLAMGGPGPYGPLLEPDENGIRLPAGFQSRVVARAGELVAGTGFEWHVFPDGGEVFRTPDRGWIYVSNAEFVLGQGVSALRFDVSGAIVDAYQICEGTLLNCAGGATPWDTWLSCEETANGLVWECDPYGTRPAVARAAMGRFTHEAVAADPTERCFYLTEDLPDGGFYRFTPESWGDLSSGRLEIAELLPTAAPLDTVAWREVPHPDPLASGDGTPTRRQVASATPFDGGEGIVFSKGRIVFTTKGDNRVWEYDPARQSLAVLYETALDPSAQLAGVDNLTASSFGDLIVAEDGGNMELVVLTPKGVVSPLLQVVGQDGSELTGPAFDPYEYRLYFSSQRADRLGITYEVSGPFRQRLHC